MATPNGFGLSLSQSDRTANHRPCKATTESNRPAADVLFAPKTPPD